MATDPRRIPACRVKIEGAELPLDQASRLTRIEVDLDTDLFGRCALVFHDPQMKLMNGADLAAGKRVEVELGFAGQLSPIFDGEVVGHEPAFRRDQPPALRVICFDLLHRLALTHSTRTFNDVDSNDAAGQIAQEAGLSADAPKGTKEYHIQGNLSDATFLRRIAQKHGQDLRLDGKRIVISEPKETQPIELGPGDQILAMKVRTSSQSQVESVSVHGWDPKAKKEIVATARGEGDIGEGARKFGSGKTLSVEAHHAPADQSTAESMARGRMRRLAEGFVRAEAQVTGDPRLVPGCAVSCSKLGEGVDGTYRIENARHVFSKYGYRTTFDAVRIAKKSVEAPPEAPERQEPPPKKASNPAAQRQAECMKEAAKDGSPLVEECPPAGDTMEQAAS
jgi:phage protein D